MTEAIDITPNNVSDVSTSDRLAITLLQQTGGNSGKLAEAPCEADLEELPDGWVMLTNETTGDTYYYSQAAGVYLRDRPGKEINYLYAGVALKPSSSVSSTMATDTETMRLLDPTQGEGAQGTSMVPAWAVNPAVRQYLSDSRLKVLALSRMGLSPFMGPAIRDIRRATALSVVSQAAFFFITYYASTCTHSGAAYPLWSWTLMIPTALFRIYAEWMGITYAVAPHGVLAQCVGLESFNVFSLRVGFTIWMLCYLFFSFLNFLDMLSDSAFTATFLRMRTCGSADGLLELWEQYWAESLPGRVFPDWTPDLPWSVILFWLLSFVQLLYPALHSWRREESCFATGRSDAGCIRDTVGEKDLKDLAFPSLGLPIPNDGVAFEVADGAGMAAMQNVYIGYSKAGLKVCSEMTGSFYDALLYVGPICELVGSRVILSFVMENSLQLSVQTSVFSMFYHLAGKQMGPVEKQALLSLGIGLATTFLKLIEASNVLKLAKDLERDMISQLGRAVLESPQIAPFVARLRRSVRIIRIGSIVLLASLCYSVAKLIGAFICDSGLLNMNGCADIHD